MCIAILTNSHPDYPFILLNNRDEYLHRPTAPAQWWCTPHDHVLGGHDLHRPAHGTWLGMTTHGRIACLTNFREEGHDPALIQGVKSRGTLPNAVLNRAPEEEEDTEEFARRLVEEGLTKGVGGFSLIFGDVRDVVRGEDGEEEEKEKGKKKGLAIISNKTPDVEGLHWILSQKGETKALSNSHYGDRTWPKIVAAEKDVETAIQESMEAKEGEKELMQRFFTILSHDTLPRQQEKEEWDIYLNQLRHSIFIPPIGKPGNISDEKAEARGVEHVQNGTGITDATSGVYGTQKQTVILVNKEGHCMFVERTLFDENGELIGNGGQDREFSFQLKNW